MIFELTQDQFNDINNVFPTQHSFGYYNNEDEKYYFDDYTEQFFDFDLDQVFLNLYSLNYSDFKFTLIEKSNTNLKILFFIKNTDTPIDQVDFTTIGLIKASPQYIQGRKQSSSYYSDIEQTDLVVKKEFIDVKNELDQLIGLNIYIYWYNNNGEIGLTKKVFKPLNKSEVYHLEVKRRSAALDYLIGNSHGTPIGPVVNQIIKRYQKEIDLWIFSNSDDFALRLIHESGQPWKSYLDYVDNDGKEDLYPDGLTMRQIILFQIGYLQSPGY